MSIRIQEINSLIKKELNKIILKEFDFPRSVLVTIIKVDTVIDLSKTNVYVSVIPSYKKDKILIVLSNNIYKIQQKLNKRLRMRIVPKIVFNKETGTEKASRIEKLLEKIKKE